MYKIITGHQIIDNEDDLIEILKIAQTFNIDVVYKQGNQLETELDDLFINELHKRKFLMTKKDVDTAKECTTLIFYLN